MKQPSRSPINIPRHLITCFPSGLTVAAARDEAANRLKNGQSQTMVDALNHIAMRELGLRWSDAMSKLQTMQNKLIGKAQKDNTSPDPASSHASQNHAHKKNSSKQQDDEDSIPTLTNVNKPKKNAPVVKLPFMYSLTSIGTLMQRYPHIGHDGYFTKNTTPAQKSEQRAALSMSLNAFNTAHFLLSQCDHIKSINRRLTARVLAEKLSDIALTKQLMAEAEFISVGAVIICAYELGFQVKHTNDGTCFNISSRSALLN